MSTLLFPPSLACAFCKAPSLPEEARTATVRMPGPGQEDHVVREWMCAKCGWANRVHPVEAKGTTKGRRRPRSGPVSR